MITVRGQILVSRPDDDPLPPRVYVQKKPSVCLAGGLLFEVVKRKGVTAGSLDGWGWREMKALSLPWFDRLAVILALVEELGVWLKGLLDA